MPEEKSQSAGQAGPDVKALMAEVKAQVEKKKEEGVYDEAEIRKLEDAAVSFEAGQEDSHQAELGLHHARMAELWDPKICAVESHRSGAVGKALVSFKRLFHRLTRFPVGVWFARQVHFNDELVQLLNTLVPNHLDLRHRVRRDERRLDALEDLGHSLIESRTRMNQGIKELKAEVKALQRDAGRGTSQIEAMLARLEDIVSEQAAAGAISPKAAVQVSKERQKSRSAAYLAFEDLHRGTREEIKERQSVYLPIFQEGADSDHPMVDLGCGRGEFLEAAKEAGLGAKGVDMNQDSVQTCRELGLDVEENDALSFLRNQQDGSLGGILLGQVIEHLTLDELMELVSLSLTKLRPGAAFVAETVNPACLTTFSGAFYLDLTHQKPIHPEAARFLLSRTGFSDVEVLYLSPYPPEARLETSSTGDQGLDGAFNRNMQRLNQIMFSHQDYAVVGRK